MKPKEEGVLGNVSLGPSVEAHACESVVDMRLSQ